MIRSDLQQHLDDHRRDIDRIDKTIVALLAERLRLGRLVGALKRDLSQPLEAPTREADVIARVRDAAQGSLPAAAAERIFATIIAETTAAQRDTSADRGDGRE